MSASAPLSTHRELPVPAAVTNSTASSYSIIVWRTRPAPKWRPEPLARLCSPDATAARCSASSRRRPVLAPVTSPSFDSTSACRTWSTRPVRPSRSRPSPRFCAIFRLSPCDVGLLAGGIPVSLPHVRRPGKQDGRMSEKLTDEEWRAFVSEGTRTGKLSTVHADGSPHVAPVWFLLDGDEL